MQHSGQRRSGTPRLTEVVRPRHPTRLFTAIAVRRCYLCISDFAVTHGDGHKGGSDDAHADGFRLSLLLILPQAPLDSLHLAGSR